MCPSIFWLHNGHGFHAYPIFGYATTRHFSMGSSVLINYYCILLAAEILCHWASVFKVKTWFPIMDSHDIHSLIFDDKVSFFHCSNMGLPY